MLSYDSEIPVLLILSPKSTSGQALAQCINRLKTKKVYLYLEAGAEAKPIQEQLPDISGIRIQSNKEIKGHDRTLWAANQWFFRHEEAGIVLNGYWDWGYLPTGDFFGFCSELLQKYIGDQRIGHISCGRMLKGVSSEKASYAFTHQPELTFYATWRRSWADFGTQLKTFRSFHKSALVKHLPALRDFAVYWQTVSSAQNLSLTEQYEYVQLINNRLCITPVEPLVDSAGNQAPAKPLQKMKHPRFMIDNPEPLIRMRELKTAIPAERPFDPTGYSFLKEQLIRLTPAAQSRLKIPKIIHHVCDYADGIPENLLALAATWKEHHPDWEQRFWNKEQMERFVHDVCPDFESCYRAYPHNVQRWDAIRYLILYHIGGMYVDLDYECFAPFDAVLSGGSCYLAVEPELNARYHHLPRIVTNALMAAKPGCGFMKMLIEELQQQEPSSFAYPETYKVILHTTGPLMVTRVYESLRNKKSVTLLPAEIFMPFTPKEVTLAMHGYASEYMNYKLENAFAVHYFLNSW